MKELSKEAKDAIANNLYDFYLYFVADNYGIVDAPHIEELSEKLTRVAFDTNYSNRICVAMPPQHSKSSLVTLAYSSWLICKHPNLRILIVNAEKELSTTFGIQIRNLLSKAAPHFGLKISKVKGSSTHLMFEKDGELQLGEIRLTGASGSITGHPADIIIVDDPYKGLEEEFTPTQLRKKWNWYTSLIEQRLRKNTKLVLLHTRWHSLDIQGKIKEDDYQRSKYDFVEYPAINSDGEPLWDEYYDLEFYEDKQKTMGERQFQAIYQQQPLDLTSDFFHVDHLHFETRFDDYPIARCRSWDLASSDDSLGDQRDYSVGIRMLKVPTGPQGQYWVFDFERGQYGNNLKRKIKNTARMDTAAYTILLETGVGTSDLLFEEYKDELEGYNVKQSKTKGASKADRATPLANAIYDGLVHVCINNPEMRETLLSELKAFPNGEHDDIVDAMAHGFNYLKKHDNDSIKTGNKRRRKRIR